MNAAILDIPILFRASAAMFIVWFLYILISKCLYKALMYLPILAKWLWVLIYKVINNIMHILHHYAGRPFINIDQAVTDLFKAVYSFIDTFKLYIESSNKTKLLARVTFVICALLAIWISLPVWLDIEQNTNIFTEPYHKFISIEHYLIETIF